jgi:hypothetical protein
MRRRLVQYHGVLLTHLSSMFLTEAHDVDMLKL